MATAASLYLLLNQRTPREKAQDALQNAQWVGEGALLHIQLDACRLVIAIEQSEAEGKSLRRSGLVADLSEFSNKTVNMRPLNDGRVVVTLIPEPISDQLITTAQNLLSKVPPSMRNRKGHTLTMYGNDGTVTQDRPLPEAKEGQWSKSDVRSALEQPNGKLTFQLRALIPNTEPGEPPAEIQPHEDAPALYDFVHAVEADASIAGYAFNLAYKGPSEARDALVLGRLEFPARIQIVVETENKAQEVANALLRCIYSDCR